MFVQSMEFMVIQWKRLCFEINYRCGYTCSPQQGNFVEILAADKETSEVVATNFTVNQYYAIDIYESCRDVHMSNGVSYFSMLQY